MAVGFVEHSVSLYPAVSYTEQSIIAQSGDIVSLSIDVVSELGRRGTDGGRADASTLSPTMRTCPVDFTAHECASVGT